MERLWESLRGGEGGRRKRVEGKKRGSVIQSEERSRLLLKDQDGNQRGKRNSRPEWEQELWDVS